MKSPPHNRVEIRSALLALGQAFDFANDVVQSRWQFAVEIHRLTNSDLGVTPCDLRWLICKNYVIHGLETTSLSQRERTFEQPSGLSFHNNSCFVLTDQGREFLHGLDIDSVKSSAPILSHGSWAATPASAPKPHWNRDRRELMVGDVVVKQFKVCAPNQELILASFEEESWPERIDDPLPPEGSIHSKRRLHDTINSLNRCQKHGLVRFTGDGTGEGVCWELIRVGA